MMFPASPHAGIAVSTARIIKVLPCHLDAHGRHTLSPSLYERDAYQFYLRRHPKECAGLRFDIQWKGRFANPVGVKMRAELRTSKNALAPPLVLERTLEPRGRFSQWSSLVLDGQGFKDAGEILAWRVTLSEGTHVLAENKSFLW